MRLNAVTHKCAGVIEVTDNAIVNAAEIVRYLDRNNNWEAARTGTGDGEYRPTHRHNAVTFIDPFDFRCPDLLRNLAKTIWYYLDDYAQRHDVRFAGIEPLNVNRYEPGDFYRPHADDGPGHNRVISALVYLNDVAEGGETEFIYQGVSVSPKAGRLIIFPSNYAYTHAAHPPVSGVKYSVAIWSLRP